MKGRHVLMAVGLVAAGSLFLFGDRSPPDDLSEAVERPVQAMSTAGAAGPSPGDAVLQLENRKMLMERRSIRHSVDVFRMQSWAPLTKPAVSKVSAPSAPPLPFEYVGRQEEGEGWMVFLADKDRTLVVRKGDLVGDEYRVEKIEPPVLTLMYLPLHEVQTMAIE